MTRRPSIALLVLFVITPLSPALAEDPPGSELAKTLVGEGDADNRVKAGLTLARTNPDALAKALDEIIKTKREGDVSVLATIAVRTKVRHVRLLTVWAASKLEGAGAAFRDKIDNDHPFETLRAAEALGFLRDREALGQLMILCRSENELIAIQAARALGRVGVKKNASEIAKMALEVDNSHVRLHLAWAVQDLLQSRKSALGAFAKYRGKKGTIGFRAKEAQAALLDELAPPEKYKVKLDVIRGYFGQRANTRPLPVESSADDDVERVKKVLASMKEKTPDYYHLIRSTLKALKIAGDQKLFEFKQRILKLQFSSMVRWDHDELVAYYLIRFTTIMFLQQMGDPSQDHRGWEEGISEAWWYAMDHTNVNVDEDLATFMKQTLKKRPW